MISYSKTCVKQQSQKDRKFVFKTNYRLMQVKNIAECSKRAFCNTFDLHKATINFVFHITVLSIFEWPLYTVTGFTVVYSLGIELCLDSRHDR